MGSQIAVPLATGISFGDFGVISAWCTEFKVPYGSSHCS